MKQYNLMMPDMEIKYLIDLYEKDYGIEVGDIDDEPFELHVMGHVVDNGAKHMLQYRHMRRI